MSYLFTELSNHHSPVLEHFPHPKKLPHAHLQSFTIPTPQLSIFCLSICLFWDMSYKWHHKIRVLLDLPSFTEHSVSRFISVAACISIFRCSLRCGKIHVTEFAILTLSQAHSSAVLRIFTQFWQLYCESFSHLIASLELVEPALKSF